MGHAQLFKLRQLSCCRAIFELLRKHATALHHHPTKIKRHNIVQNVLTSTNLLFGKTSVTRF